MQYRIVLIHVFLFVPSGLGTGTVGISIHVGVSITHFKLGSFTGTDTEGLHRFHLPQINLTNSFRCLCHVDFRWATPKYVSVLAALYARAQCFCKHPSPDFIKGYPPSLSNEYIVTSSNIGLTIASQLSKHRYLEIICTEAGCMKDMRHNPDCSKVKGIKWKKLIAATGSLLSVPLRAEAA